MTVAIRASDRGLAFTGRKEGLSTKAYKDSGGVITIGRGSTMLDPFFAAYWRKTRGHDLRMGDTITVAEADMMLRHSMEATYAPAVAKRFNNLAQHEFDGAADMTYNCGPGTLKDRWATALGERRIGDAAKLLLSTRVTAAGKFVQGLVSRRTAQGRLIQLGDYGDAKQPAPHLSLAPADIKVYQEQLTRLGYYKGKIDGTHSYVTDKAVRAFQRDNDLTVDGQVGPATRATLARAVQKTKTTTAAAQAGGAGAAASGAAGTATAVDATDFPHLLEWAIGLGVVAVVAIIVVSVIWRNRGVILKRRTPA